MPPISALECTVLPEGVEAFESELDEQISAAESASATSSGVARWLDPGGGCR